jgi:hypothetical protein
MAFTTGKRELIVRDVPVRNSSVTGKHHTHLLSCESAPLFGFECASCRNYRTQGTSAIHYQTI